MSTRYSAKVCQATDEETKASISNGLREFPRAFGCAARALDVNTSTLSRWLTGEINSPRIDRSVPLLLILIKGLRKSKGAFLPAKKKALLPKKNARRKRKGRVRLDGGGSD